MELIRWEAPEFEDHERGTGWYYFVTCAALILIAVFLWQNNFLFAVFIAASAILLFVWGAQKAPIRNFIITEREFQIDRVKTIYWNDIKSFSLRGPRGEEKFGELFIDLKSFRPDLHIQVPPESVEAARAELRHYLPEREHNDSLIDAILRFLRF